jgi:hypothetical protein
MISIYFILRVVADLVARFVSIVEDVFWDKVLEYFSSSHMQQQFISHNCLL